MHRSGARTGIGPFGELMRRLLLVASLAASLAGLPTVALAHAEFVSSEPSGGDVVDEPPTEVVITFDGELRPEISEFLVTGPGGEVGVGAVDLEVAERNVLRGAVAIREPGVYTVAWTAVAVDGHRELGDFSFTVGGGEVPETALATAHEPMRLAVSLAGAALLLVTAILLRRRSGG
jgi:methionine-rich copper-binding protein CopC